MNLEFALRILAASATMLLSVQGVAADTVADFYRGKTIYMIVGAGPGGAYDLVGRAIASHLGRHIPGGPSVIVQNMAGAASLIMVNHLYNRAPRDGTTMGLPLNGILLEPRLKLYSGAGANVKFDLAKMSWVGSPSQQPPVLWVWHTAPFKSFADFQARGATLGATSPSADNYTLPLIINNLLGGKVKIISGYPAVTDIFVAAERGEIQGNTTPLSSITVGKPEALSEGKIRILAQFGIERVSRLPDIPTGIELAKDDRTRRILEFYALRFRSAYPIALPPDVPADRVKALQRAFDDMVVEPTFVETAARTGLDLSPIGGAEIGRIIAKLESFDQNVIDQLRAALSLRSP